MSTVHKINWKQLLISIGIALGIGGLSALVTMNSMENYETMIKPPLSPPAFLFPIVWTILFTLMGISSYLIFNSDDNRKSFALFIYGAQLAVNFFWPIFFFNFSAYLLSFIWILLLWLLIILMIKLFYPINKVAALLQIPYLLWVTFAAYLNFGVFILN
jgi:tryptophan-rich sensory protein